MIVLFTRAIRSLSKSQLELLPRKCYAQYYLPHSANDICDCVYHCKYKPPPNNFIQNLVLKETVKIQVQPI